MVLSDALAVQSQRYQGQRFQVPRLFWDLKKIIWGPKKCFEISKIVLESQKMVYIVDHVSIVGNAVATDIVGIVNIVDDVDIVDTVEAIWNNARLCNNQSQKRQ